MTLRPCIVCGLPTAHGRCIAHDHCRRAPSGVRGSVGMTHAWDRLSKRARRMQPFCIDCGATTDLQCDHTPEAWARRAAGQQDPTAGHSRSGCGDCNRKRGAARGNAVTRGDDLAAARPDPTGKPR